MSPGWGQWLCLSLIFALLGGTAGGAMWAWTGSTRTRGGFFALGGLTLFSFAVVGIFGGYVDWDTFWVHG